MDHNTVIAILELISAIGTVVLFFIGTTCAVKTLKADEEGTAEGNAKAAKLYRRSFMLIGLAVLAYGLTNFFMTYDAKTAEGAALSAIAAESLWEGIRSTGFLILVPVILRKWHPKNAK